MGRTHHGHWILLLAPPGTIGGLALDPIGLSNSPTYIFWVRCTATFICDGILMISEHMGSTLTSSWTLYRCMMFNWCIWRLPICILYFCWGAVMRWVVGTIWRLPMGHKSPFQTPTLKADALPWARLANHKQTVHLNRLNSTFSNFNLEGFVALVPILRLLDLSKLILCFAFH